LKRILITGGAGFIGLNLAKEYSKGNYIIDIIDDFSRGRQDNELYKFLRLKNVNLIKKNIEKKINLRNSYHFIFHLAAVVGVENVTKNPLETFKKNMNILYNVLDFAKKQKKLKRFIFFSTSEVYAGAYKNYKIKIPTKENTPITLSELSHSRTSYMLSKISGEYVCKMSNIPYTIFRPHNIYGPRMGYNHVIPETIQKIHNLKRKNLINVYSFNHKRSFCYISDAVHMIKEVIKNNKTINKTFNLGNEKPEITILDLVKKIINISQKKIKIKKLPPTEGSPERRAPNMSKTFSYIKKKKNISLEEGLLKTFSWYKNNL
tara:strand:+ start:15241 stop:16197 length:957 start_codon:yes stop_codon:yes gene_type:complete